MNIDDILESVDKTAYEETNGPDLYADGDLGGSRDLRHLTRLWMVERAAPELTEWPEELMDRVTSQIKQQIELVEDLTGNSDPKTNFRLVIIQTELERYKYLVRSLLRTRIAKIDAFTLHYLSLQPSPMSSVERQYAKQHTAILHRHYKDSFLSAMPNSLQRLDDKDGGGASMIEGPDLDKAVFVRCVRDMSTTVEVPGTDIAVSMRAGDVIVVRWSAIKEAVTLGECELV